MIERCALLAAMLAASLAAGPVGADVIVYHSDAPDGSGPRDPIVVPVGTPITLHLFMDERDGSVVPSNPWDACHQGTGNERCSYDVAIESSGGVSLNGFTPFGDVVAGDSATRVRMNGGDYDQGDSGPVKLGDLNVVSTDTGTVTLAEGTIITPVLTTESVSPRTILFVPEPHPALVVVVGGGLLATLGRLRKRVDA